MEKASRLLGRVMLCIFAGLIAASLLITLSVGLESKSYLFALALGFAGALVLLLLRRRVPELPALRRAGAARVCAALAALCLAVNLAWVLIIRLEPFSDYETYWQCACALAFGREIASTEYIAVYPHILGYSSFLSIFLRLFGEHIMVGAVLNVVLTTLSGVLIFALCNTLIGLESAAAAFTLWIFMPTKLMMNSLIFSEPLYTCLLLLFMLLLVMLERAQDTLCARPAACVPVGLGLGLLLCAINIVRPIAVILIIAYMIWLLLLRGRAERVGRLWLVWGLITLCMLGSYKLCGELWNGHVETVLGEEPASLPVYNIYVGFNEQTQGQWSADDMDVLFGYKRNEGLSAGEAQMRMLPHLKDRLSSGIDFGRLFRAKLFAFMGNDEIGGYTYRWTHSESFVRICMIIDNIYYFAVIALLLAGVHRLLIGRVQSAALVVPLFSLGLTLAHMLVEVSSRYHYSLIPMFIIIAAFAADSKIKAYGGNKHDAETVYSNSLL